MMSGGFLMFPKIVSEGGICFTKASIYLPGMDFLCKHRLSDSVVAPEDWTERIQILLVKLLNW